MCGRYTLISGRDEYLRYFGIEEFDEFEDRPRYNVAPSQWLPVVVGYVSLPPPDVATEDTDDELAW